MSPGVDTNDTLVFQTTNSSTPQFTDTNLLSNTSFFYKLSTFDVAGLSSESNEISATTLSAVPQPYVLNNRTIFSVNFDEPYQASPPVSLPSFVTSSGTIIPAMSLVFPELADDPTIPDQKDCRVIFGSSYSTITGKFGLALHGEGLGTSFEPDPSLIRCKNTKTQTIGTNTAHPDFTVGFWFKSDPNDIPLGAGGSQILIVPGNTDRPFVANTGYGLAPPRGIIMNIIEPPLVSFTDLSDNQWHHVIEVFDRTQGILRLYIDGVLDTTFPVLSHVQFTATGGSTQYIGASFNGTGVLRGDLDDLWIEDHPWTLEEVEAFFRGQQMGG